MIVGGGSVRSLRTFGMVAMGVVGATIVGLPLYALPATRSLPPGPRPGIEEMALAEAADRLKGTGKKGANLVEAARALVADRMQYCRRNSFDSPQKAFQRGYGYCTQQAYALTDLLARLGIESKPVYTFRSRFPDGKVGGHTWVRVTLDGEERDLDLLFYDADMGEPTFIPLSTVRHHTPLFKWVTQWGEAAVNAHRYYRTGEDFES
jgi:transglutaminase-like putative cysteine protease